MSAAVSVQPGGSFWIAVTRYSRFAREPNGHARVRIVRAPTWFAARAGACVELGVEPDLVHVQRFEEGKGMQAILDRRLVNMSPLSPPEALDRFRRAFLDELAAAYEDDAITLRALGMFDAAQLAEELALACHKRLAHLLTATTLRGFEYRGRRP